MQAREVLELLNIDRERLKYYKKMEVFSPELGTPPGNRTEYTERDLRNLKRLEVLTKAGLTCDDIKEIQVGALTLEEAFEKRRQIIMDDLRRKQSALKLSETLMDAGVEYETLPAEALWDAVRRKEDAGEVFMEPDYGYVAVPLTRSIRCPHCGETQEVDLEDYLYDETCNPSTRDDDMGPDIVYSFDTTDGLTCEKCGGGIHVEGWIREYPVGAYDSEHISIESVDEEE